MKIQTKFDVDLWLKQWLDMFSFVPVQVATVLAALRLSSRAGVNLNRWQYLLGMLDMAQRLWLHLEEYYFVCPNCGCKIPINCWLKVTRQTKYCDCIDDTNHGNKEVLASSFDQNGNRIIWLETLVISDEESAEQKTVLILQVSWDLLGPETGFVFGQPDLSVLDEF